MTRPSQLTNTDRQSTCKLVDGSRWSIPYSPDDENRRRAQKRDVVVQAVVVLIIAFALISWAVEAAGPEPQRPPAAVSAPAGDVYEQGGYGCDVDEYENAYGDCVRWPVAAPAAPMGSTARCRDGTYSFSRSRSGTCSHHGGVSSWQ
jgi:hypothetical protein